MTDLAKSGGLRCGVALVALAALSACGGGGGGSVNSTPPPPVAVVPPPAPPPPPPPPPPASNFDTAEYRTSNAVVQSNALPAYQRGANGAGVIAAVIDSGVIPNNIEFAGRIHPASADLASNRGLGDEGGHGTAVSHVLLGARNDVATFGVAFGATLLAARTDTPGSCNANPDEGCSHNDNNIARGVDLAVANNARVINISLGGSPANNALRAAIDRATAAGVVLVFSGGNEFDSDPARAANPDPLAQIANESIARNQVIIAGALDSTNRSLTGFSNRAGNGAQHYLAALGSRILAIDENGSQVRVSGTSFAAPIVSGAVALLAQAFPNMSGAQIVDLLLRTATDLGAPGTDPIFGRGAIDIGRAFAPQGQMSLAGSDVAIAPGAGGTASPAMGDAAQSGMSAVILDGYGRAYQAGVGALTGATASSKLALALALNGRNFGAGLPGMAVSLAVGPGHDRPVVERLMLSPHDRAQASALAGNVITKLGKDTRLAFGVSQGSDGLTRVLTDERAPAFLVSAAGSESIGFDRRGQTSLAVAQRIGSVSLIAHAEDGEAQSWQARSGWQRYRTQSAGLTLAKDWRRVSTRLGIERLTERETVLGGRFGALFGAPGAASWMAGIEGGWSFAPAWRIGMAWREGWTRIGAGGARFGTDRLRSRAWSLDLERAGLLTGADRLAVRVAQPLRVTSGGFDLSLPSGYDYAAGVTSTTIERLNLAPQGREIDAEAAYSRALGRGWLSANLYWRQDPGHIAAAPDDLGAAIRFTAGF